MQKAEYIESVKDKLEELLEQGNSDYYQKGINKQEIKVYMSEICSNLSDFDGDTWQLAEMVAGAIYEHCAPQLPGSGLVAYMVLRLFRNGIKTVCHELNS